MLRFLVAVTLLLGACKEKQAQPQQAPQEPPPPTQPATPSPSKIGKPVAPGTLRNTTADTAYGVVVSSGQDVATLSKLARDKGPGLEVGQVPFKDLFNEQRLALATKQMPAEEVAALKASPAVLVIHGSGGDALTLARRLATVAAELADTAHGWVFDPESFAIYSAADFHAHVPGDHVDVRNLIVVHTITPSVAGKPPYMDTTGMHRYILPNLYVPEVATEDIERMTSMIDAAAQVLVEGGDVDASGQIAIDFHKLGWHVSGKGSGTAVWKTRWSRDPSSDEDVVELVPPAGDGLEAQKKLLDDCFGRQPAKAKK